MQTGNFNRAYLSLGSNIEPEKYLPAAVRELCQLGTITAVSKVYESAPVGDENQAYFLNAAVLLETELSAVNLRLNAIAEIEQRLHRVRDPDNVNAARTIDIDIALFNHDIIAIEHRRIPDPDILTRPFLAVPLAELDPEYLHPGEGQTLHEIAFSLTANSAKSRLRFREDVQLGEVLNSSDD
jgi:2-amino-4-hydroxy-6-hydroxymethyldihydropteridine diphosphokinase